MGLRQQWRGVGGEATRPKGPEGPREEAKGCEAAVMLGGGVGKRTRSDTDTE